MPPLFLAARFLLTSAATAISVDFAPSAIFNERMKSFQLIAHGNPGRFELRDVPEPKPAPDEVVVQVEACGLNHLDLWLEEGGLPVQVPLPRTPGGEVSGRIAELGANVKDWQRGDAVAVQSNLFCGECEF